MKDINRRRYRIGDIFKQGSVTLKVQLANSGCTGCHYDNKANCLSYAPVCETKQGSLIFVKI